MGVSAGAALISSAMVEQVLGRRMGLVGRVGRSGGAGVGGRSGGVVLGWGVVFVGSVEFPLFFFEFFVNDLIKPQI